MASVLTAEPGSKRGCFGRRAAPQRSFQPDRAPRGFYKCAEHGFYILSSYDPRSGLAWLKWGERMASLGVSDFIGSRGHWPVKLRNVVMRKLTGAKTILLERGV